MKQVTYIPILCLLISLSSVAQKESFIYQPRVFQTSIRIGLVNTSLNAEYRLNPKTIALVDFGLGFVYLQSNHYNRFNEEYNKYNEYYDNFLNLGWSWWCPYSSVQIRRIIRSRSHVKYTSSPYANTFTYYGIQVKYNGRELKNWMKADSVSALRETYQFAAFFGRQMELGKKANVLCDLYIGFGGICNYKLTAVEPQWIIGARFGVPFWSINK